MSDTKTYRATGDGGRIIPVKGKPITIEEYKDIELFIHRPVSVFLSGPVKSYPFTDIISEVLTGRTGGRGTTRKEAVDHAIQNMNKAGGYAKVKKIINRMRLPK